MIIEAKSTRQAAEATDGRKRFEFLTPERLSKLPLYVAAFVVGLAAYLKSTMEGRAIAMAPQPEAGSAPQDLQTPVNWCLPGGELPTGFEGDGIDPVTTGSLGADEAEPSNMVGGTGPAWPGRYVPMNSPTIQFAKPFEPFSPSIQAFFPAAFGLFSSNDNPILVAPVPEDMAGAPADSSPPDVNEGEDDSDPVPDDNDDGDPVPDDNDDDPRSNRAPVVMGPVRLNDVFAGQVVLIGLSQLLFGAHDPDGDSLLISNVSATGVAIVRSTNGWTLSAEPGSLGHAVVTYEISDGHSAVLQTAYFDIIRNGRVLTPDDDLHAGTPYDDDIDALAGDDIIDALGGNDLVVGGTGDDHINGGVGDDHLFGGAGDDVIFGGQGDDIILGGDGSDRLFGDEGDDTIDGEAGDDLLFGGDGNDLISGGTGQDALEGGAGDDILVGGADDDHLQGGSGDDALLGGAGDDLLMGGPGDDALEGGDGSDVLHGGDGDDQLSGGSGADLIMAEAGDDRIRGDAGNDVIDAGDGYDILDLSATCDDLVVDAHDGLSYSADFGDDSFTAIEEIVGGAGDDLFVLGATATVVRGGGGRDTFVFAVTDEDPTLSEDVMHDILDFVVGDRIRVRDYEIDRAAQQLEKDLFKSVYQDDDDDWLKSDLPIIVRHERANGVDQTVIMADIDHDDVYEITINIHGIHLPINFEPSIA